MERKEFDVGKSALVQSRVKQETKEAADSLFESLGLDTPTAVRIFLAKSLQVGGLPFAVTAIPNQITKQAMTDVAAEHGISGPFESADALIDAALADA
ncbi:MAG: type II toxin-antitoxin system RelB/DinJ family antitoxin [Bifidobacteriaceae bacterium]|jgi:DNA-damage-inducible protein J|nr:type II toxin-antitoxin system RelB/DinJ family antitoxin [Bifidobacteriaceae bacterium]